MIWNIMRNTEKLEKGEMLTVGTGIWPENYNTWKMRETHSRT
jgi:hypothetical protein